MCQIVPRDTKCAYLVTNETKKSFYLGSIGNNVEAVINKIYVYCIFSRLFCDILLAMLL